MTSIVRLIATMKRLRDPQKGCPWDLAQTPDSLKEYILEETYEVLEAIDHGDPARIAEELGDLLLQIVFLAQIFSERGDFSIQDVAERLNEKLVRRHPHIFAQGQARDAEEVRRNWEQIKMAEKGKRSVVSDYPAAMPALLTAGRISAQASTVGFDWNDPRQALEKVREETAELDHEIEAGDLSRAEAEIGDLLFATANVARLLKVNAEFALGLTNQKFVRRFRTIEDEIRSRGDQIETTPLAEMEEIWNRVKREE